jgi:hypothetical protein
VASTSAKMPPRPLYPKPSSILLRGPEWCGTGSFKKYENIFIQCGGAPLFWSHLIGRGSLDSSAPAKRQDSHFSFTKWQIQVDRHGAPNARGGARARRRRVKNTRRLSCAHIRGPGAKPPGYRGQGAPGGRACSRGFPPRLGFRPRPRGRCVPMFRNGAATRFIGIKNFTAARVARRAPSPPRSRGVTVLPFPNFAFICERGAVKTGRNNLQNFRPRRERKCARTLVSGFALEPALILVEHEVCSVDLQVRETVKYLSRVARVRAAKKEVSDDWRHDVAQLTQSCGIMFVRALRHRCAGHRASGQAVDGGDAPTLASLLIYPIDDGHPNNSRHC